MLLRGADLNGHEGVIVDGGVHLSEAAAAAGVDHARARALVPRKAGRGRPAGAAAHEPARRGIRNCAAEGLGVRRGAGGSGKGGAEGTHPAVPVEPGRNSVWFGAAVDPGRGKTYARNHVAPAALKWLSGV